MRAPAFLLLLTACAAPQQDDGAVIRHAIPTRALTDLQAHEAVLLDYSYHAEGLEPVLAQTVRIERLEDGWTFEAWAWSGQLAAPDHLGKVWIQPDELEEWQRLLTEHRVAPQPKKAPRTLLDVTWQGSDLRVTTESWSCSSGGDWEPTDWLAPVGDPLTQKLRAAAASLKLRDESDA